jgi:lysophospholipase L1-like esterase
VKKNLVLSLSLNVLFILYGICIIHGRGGFSYLKERLNPRPPVKQDINKVYYQTKESIFEAMPADTGEIVFVGNSITDYCDWYELFGNQKIRNRGISGDVINGVIGRLDEIVRAKPEKIFLMIGINDLGQGNSVQEILENYKRLIRLIKEKSPRTKLYLQSILPTFRIQDRSNEHIMAINDGLKDLASENECVYVDLFSLLKTKKNELDTVYSFDGIHLNGKGYLVWKQAIEQYVNH